MPSMIMYCAHCIRVWLLQLVQLSLVAEQDTWYWPLDPFLAYFGQSCQLEILALDLLFISLSGMQPDWQCLHYSRVMAMCFTTVSETMTRSSLGQINQSNVTLFRSLRSIDTACNWKICFEGRENLTGDCFRKETHGKHWNHRERCGLPSDTFRIEVHACAV